MTDILSFYDSMNSYEGDVFARSKPKEISLFYKNAFDHVLNAVCGLNTRRMYALLSYENQKILIRNLLDQHDTSPSSLMNFTKASPELEKLEEILSNENIRRMIKFMARHDAYAKHLLNSPDIYESPEMLEAEIISLVSEPDCFADFLNFTKGRRTAEAFRAMDGKRQMEVIDTIIKRRN